MSNPIPQFLFRRLAIHTSVFLPAQMGNAGSRSFAHFPATPWRSLRGDQNRRNCCRNLASIHRILQQVCSSELFTADVYAHIRRAHGLVSASHQGISPPAHTLRPANTSGAAIASHGAPPLQPQSRTPYFHGVAPSSPAPKPSMNPSRPADQSCAGPGNPFLAYVGAPR